MNCIVLSNIVNYIVYNIKHWMGSEYVQKPQQICKICTEKHFVVQCFILIVCNNHVQ